MMDFRGIWPALVTPLTPQGQLDVPATERLIDGLVAAGIGGLYVCGGTGEGVLLPEDVRRQMAEVAVARARGRVPVMVHVGALRTETAVELARHANQVGCDAISAVPPFYYSLGFEAVKRHYAAITDASKVPLYIYHIPGATGVSLSLDQLLELCAMEGIAGLKYSSHDLYTLSRLLAARDPERVTVLSGPDELFLPCYSLGADGAIGTTYNFMPRLYIDIIGAVQHHDLATARRLQFAANDIIAVLLRYGAIPATKALLGMIGYDVGQGMPPMPPVEGDDLTALRQDLEDAGLFGLLRRHAIYGPEGDPARGDLA